MLSDFEQSMEKRYRVCEYKTNVKNERPRKQLFAKKESKSDINKIKWDYKAKNIMKSLQTVWHTVVKIRSFSPHCFIFDVIFLSV